ncbi:MULTISPECIES: hypothetical protein [unclassified Rhodococcus (in: high G+C Gram-positive bacteria)]|uniref:hypothetical protein n=1 Tax=Rhodococcus sp. SJ-3 TaxID=3454628 RepID=UPI003F794943
MSIRSTSNAKVRSQTQHQRPHRIVEHDGPSFTEAIHSRLFSNYEPPRGDRPGAA